MGQTRCLTLKVNTKIHHNTPISYNLYKQDQANGHNTTTKYLHIIFVKVIHWLPSLAFMSDSKKGLPESANPVQSIDYTTGTVPSCF